MDGEIQIPDEEFVGAEEVLVSARDLARWLGVCQKTAMDRFRDLAYCIGPSGSKGYRWKISEVRERMERDRNIRSESSKL